MFIRLNSISKSYAGVPALARVSLDIPPESIIGLVGENGAGKSTLMKILSGVERADAGEILIDGKKQRWRTPAEARKAGITMVFQELSVIPQLSVRENILLGNLPQKSGALVNWTTANTLVDEVLLRLELNVAPDTLVEKLSIAQRQMVEIARALAQKARLLILDEPTSALSDHDARHLLKIIRGLRQDRVSIVLVTHRLDEIFAVAETIAVLRDGHLVDSKPAGDFDRESIIAAMVGRKLAEQFPERISTGQGHPDKPVLEVKNAARIGEFEDISFELYPAQILGIAGLMGAGRTELVEALFGARPLESGEIRLGGVPVRINSPADAVGIGLGLIPDDRQGKGLVPEASVHFNLMLNTLSKSTNRLGTRNHQKERRRSSKLVESLQIKLVSLKQLALNLSGGNQQKVVVAKTIAADCRVLIFDEPTRGIDVGAKREIYLLIRRMAERGAAVIVVSSELEEILGIADRVLVMREGKIQGVFPIEEASQERIMQLAVGA
jgi:ribose transport system ATP-binding protein